MIQLDNLTVGYRDGAVLRDLNFEIPRGECFGLAGPNGCGKTTLLRTLCGTLSPLRGSIRLGGVPLDSLSVRYRARRIAVLSQEFTVGWPYTVGELTAMGRSPYLSNFGRVTLRDKEIIAEAMELAEVAELSDRSVMQLSGGERQRVRLAMCFAQQPDVLILDEPTNHLDPGGQLRMLDRIDCWRRRTGLTVVAVLHDLNLMAEYCDRMVLLTDGHMVAEGPVDQVLTAQRVEQIYRIPVSCGRHPTTERPFFYFHTHVAAQ